MKSMKKILQAVLISIPLIITATGSAMAASHEGNITSTEGNMQMQQSHKPKKDNKLERLTKKLNLTDEQQNMILQKLDAITVQMQKYMSQMRDSRQQLAKMAIQGNFDNNKIHQLAKQQGDAMTQMTVLRMQTKQAIFTALTPDQQKAYLGMMQQRHDKMQQMKQGNGRKGKQGHCQGNCQKQMQPMNMQ